MGLGGAAVEGAQKALNKMGFGGLSNALGLDEVKKKMEEIAEGIEKADGNANSFKNKFEVLKGGIKEAGSQLKTSLKDPLVVTGFLMDQMMDALTKADKETGELAKAFGTSYSEAAGLRGELNTMANLSGDVNITTSALQKSLIEVNKEFKTATMFSADLLEDFTNLTEVAGYTNEAAQRLSKISVATGTDLSDNTAKILGTAKAFNDN
jgi:archaellum component FlaC